MNSNNMLQRKSIITCVIQLAGGVFSEMLKHSEIMLNISNSLACKKLWYFDWPM